MIATLWRAGVLTLLTLVSSPAAFAEKEWAVTVLGGQYSGSQLLKLGGGTLDFKDSYTAGLSLSYQFVDWGPHMRWELEGQALKHVGEQEHVEFASSINVRWITFPWNRYLVTSVLHYLLIEAAVGLPNSNWSLVARVHHRSGIFGLFSHSGSNVLALGLRYRF